MIKKLSFILFSCLLFATSALSAVSYQLPTLQFKQGQADVVGSVATLAISTAVDISFDIGPDWAQYNEVGCTIVAGGSTTSAVLVYQGDAISAKTYRTIYDRTGLIMTTLSWAPATNPVSFLVRVGSRYVTFTVSNLDATNAFSAGNWYCRVGV